MKTKSSFAFFLVLSMIISIIPTISAAPTINVSTEKQTYSYGDYLTFTIEVSQITGEIAILHIIDGAGKKSSAIPISITESKTTVPSPFAFEQAVYPTGKYILEIEYSGSTSTTEFELIDSGRIVIPFWIKDFSSYWVKGQISDIEFAMGIEFLIKEGIIVIPETQSQQQSNEIKIPHWIKTNTQWWLERKISDTDFVSGIEYLIKNGIIVI